MANKTNKKTAENGLRHIVYGLALVLGATVEELGISTFEDVTAGKAEQPLAEAAEVAEQVEQTLAMSTPTKNAEMKEPAPAEMAEKAKAESPELQAFKKVASPLLVEVVYVLRGKGIDSSYIEQMFARYGAKGLGTIPADKRDAFIAELQKIIGEKDVTQDA